MVAADLAIPHFLEEIHRPTMVAPVGPDLSEGPSGDPSGGSTQHTQKQHIVGISGNVFNHHIGPQNLLHHSNGHSNIHSYSHGNSHRNYPEVLRNLLLFKKFSTN